MLIRCFSVLLYSGLTYAASGPTFPVLTYSTYLRDSFTPTAIATDPSGNIYMAGNATVNPVTSQVTVLVMKLNPQASQYLYVRYLGGSVNDQANALAVDSAGNAYVAGVTTSPDFPVTSGGNLGTAPTATSPQKSFVAKLDPNGDLVFSDLLGGTAQSVAQAVAVNAASQVLVSGTSQTLGFPTTPGAYSVSDTTNHPYLLELDPTGTKMIFSATGIGGSALALDSSGNIYVAGTTSLLDYPTTPGSYQPTFPAFNVCTGIICEVTAQGANQYVTKVDPTGSKLIYSTALSGSGQTTNTGLAVDAAGDVYLTGYAGTTYPYTVTAPSLPNAGGLVTFAAPFLSKLDPAGQTLLFSVPVGGAGVQVDSNGAVYVGGVVGSSPLRNYAVPANIPALASVPTQCLPNVTVQSIDTVQNIGNTAYVAQVDGASGNLRGSQFIGGSSLTASAVTLVGSTLWIAGATNFPNFPFTPNALTLASFGPAPLAGAYLGSVDFSQPQLPAGTPQIGCIVDAADFAPAGPVARYQLLTIFGSGLSPATAGSAPVGVSFSVASAPPLNAPLLYVSPTQINVAVPLVSFSQSSSVMQLTVNGASSAPIELPLTYANPSLFAVALNADGSLNSSTNPAALGSAVSVFVNGLTPDPQVNNSPLQLFTNDGWSITNVILASRNLEKCLRIQKRAAGIEVTQIDADDASAVAAIARRHGAKLIVNAALPYQDLSIMEGCLAAGAHYLDTANYEPPDVARFEYRWQWEYHERFEKSGLMALLGCGFDPGQTNIYCAWAAKHLFDEIETLDILDCNDGQHGHPFATNFNPEVNIREVTAPGRYWENGEWHETAPLHITANFDFPEIGSRKTYLMFHEELESLTRHFPSLRRARFWMTFSDRYLNYLRVLQDVGMTRIDEVDFEGRKIVPLRFLKSLLPDPAGMGANYQGRTCIGCLISGTKAGTRRRVFLSNTCDHAECNREVGAQAISYTTGVGAACGAALMLDGTWMRPGVFNVEQFDPDPFMELAAAWGLPWSIREMPVSDAASI